MAGHTCSSVELNNLENQARVTTLEQISWREFLRLEEQYRITIREALKNNQGFTDMEKADMRDRSSKYTLRNCDAVLYGGFEKILVKYIPHITIDDRIRKLVKES